MSNLIFSWPNDIFREQASTWNVSKGWKCRIIWQFLPSKIPLNFMVSRCLRDCPRYPYWGWYCQLLTLNMWYRYGNLWIYKPSFHFIERVIVPAFNNRNRKMRKKGQRCSNWRCMWCCKGNEMVYLWWWLKDIRHS